MTAYDDMNTIVTAMREGAFDFVVKPIALDTLHDLVERVFADRSVRRKPRGAPTIRQSFASRRSSDATRA